jgi:hypothetical protein
MTPVMERYMREVFDPRTFPNYLRLFQELDAHSVLHHLRDIHVPALVVSGAWDWLTPAYQSHVIANASPTPRPPPPEGLALRAPGAPGGDHPRRAAIPRRPRTLVT